MTLLAGLWIQARHKSAADYLPSSLQSVDCRSGCWCTQAPSKPAFTRLDTTPLESKSWAFYHYHKLQQISRVNSNSWFRLWTYVLHAKYIKKSGTKRLVHKCPHPVTLSFQAMSKACLTCCAQALYLPPTPESHSPHFGKARRGISALAHSHYLQNDLCRVASVGATMR